MSKEGEEEGAGLCIEGGLASLETLLLLVASVWLALWPSRGTLSCSNVLLSEAGADLAEFSDVNPEPKSDD